MNQNISSLNLPRNLVLDLQKLGVNSTDDITHLKETEQIQTHSLCFSAKEAPQTRTGLDIYKEELVNGCILTFNEDIDNLLNNEIIPKSVTEFVGYPGSGKSQVCLTLCMSVQLPKWCGGINGDAIYISTDKGFSSHRLRELTHNFIEKYEELKNQYNIVDGFNKDSVLKRIYVIEISDQLELVSSVKYLEEFLPEKNVKLLVIDSIAYPIRLINTTERKTFIYNIFKELQSLSEQHNFSVVVTNDLTTRINLSEVYNPPLFGESFYHCVNTRVVLTKKSPYIFHANLVKSVLQGTKETYFCL